MNWAQFSQATPELAALGDELMLGMMWRSPKALDLLRDDCCVLHSCVSDRAGTQGDFKLYGRARAAEDAEVHRAYRAAVKVRIDWDPPREFHVFEIDITSAGYIVFGDDAFGMAWDPERGTRRWTQREA